MGHYDTELAMSLTLENLKSLMKAAGVTKLFCKHLASNDNSKNQPYFGSDLSSINIIPTGHVVAEPTRSSKPGASGQKIFKAPVDLHWIIPNGQQFPAPNSKIIFYPQYPETRFSGFLTGSDIDLREWMDSSKKGRYPDRFLFLGVTSTRKVISYLAVTNSALSNELLSVESTYQKHGLFLEIPLQTDDSKAILLAKLKSIVDMEWIKGGRLSNGVIVPCNSPNCGGYTLEALLEISPNGYAEPDFLGWEVKQFNVPAFSRTHASIITLMTPEPDGGLYASDGVESFIRRFGYPDQNGKVDRLNFGGVHKFSQRHERTTLRLELLGYDTEAGKIVDADGGIALLNDAGDIAASWGYTKLIDHWKRKHNKAVYVPSMCHVDVERQYRFGSKIRLCEGTDFLHVLGGICGNKIYYDPGIKLENASGKPTIKRRSQFRIKSGDIDDLYNQVTFFDLHSLNFTSPY